MREFFQGHKLSWRQSWDYNSHVLTTTPVVFSSYDEWSLWRSLTGKSWVCWKDRGICDWLDDIFGTDQLCQTCIWNVCCPCSDWPVWKCASMTILFCVDGGSRAFLTVKLCKSLTCTRTAARGLTTSFLFYFDSLTLNLWEERSSIQSTNIYLITC